VLAGLQREDGAGRAPLFDHVLRGVRGLDLAGGVFVELEHSLMIPAAHWDQVGGSLGPAGAVVACGR
jgi:hypothetical protein